MPWVLESVGEVVDADLPRPKADVAYYARWPDGIKTGALESARRRPAEVRHDEPLAS